MMFKALRGWGQVVFRRCEKMPGPFIVGICAAVLLAVCVARAAEPGVVTPQQRVSALLTRLARVEEQIPPAERFGPGQLAQARLALRKIAGAPSYWGDPAQQTEKALADAEKAVDLLEKGVCRVEPGTGFQERAYIAPMDGSPEPYLLYVPTSYDAKRAWPLLIFLHGYHPDLDASNWIDLQYSPSLQEVCEKEGVILLLPFGRRNTEFMGVGETDVLLAIEYARRDYNVDPRRIIMSGASMGGSGAYSIACHYPDRFAAVIGISGRADYYQWMNVSKESLPPFKQGMMDADYARELLPNLLHVPVLIFHGAQDSLVQNAQSQQLEARLKQLGQRVQYVELPDTGHNDAWTPSFTHPKFRDILRNARLEESPKRVTFRTMTLKYPGAYWLRIEALQTWGRMARVDANVTAPNTIELTVENVGQLTLGPSTPELLFDPKVILNGKPVKGNLREDGLVEVSLSQTPTPGKTPSMCGPIREAYNAPFLIVYPADTTVKGAAEDRGNASRLLLEWAGCSVMPLPSTQEQLPRALSNWDAFNLGPLPIRADDKITDKEIADHNLILCGSPATNKVLARIADKLPLRIEGGEYVIGAHRFASEGRGVECIYPNPLNPKRYVLVVHGVPWGTGLSVNHKLDFQPDFIIYSKRTVEDGTLFPTNGVLCAGWFDQSWRVSPDSTWVNPAPEKAQPVPDALR